MDVSEYTFNRGNQLGLILFGSDPFFTYRPRSATEFTVNIGPGTFLSLPMVAPITIPVMATPDIVEIELALEEIVELDAVIEEAAVEIFELAIVELEEAIIVEVE